MIERDDRGATLVEFAAIFSILLMIAIGAFEWGMGFRDQLSVSQAVREGGRVGAATGDFYVDVDHNADCAILESAAGALSAIGGNDVNEIWIYESDANGSLSVTNRQRYRPKVDTDNPASLTCGSGWLPLQTGWPPTARDNVGTARDWIGVRVVLDHHWKTNFLWWNGSVEWHESVVFHLEPKIIN